MDHVDNVARHLRLVDNVGLAFNATASGSDAESAALLSLGYAAEELARSVRFALEAGHKSAPASIVTDDAEAMFG